MTDEVVGGLGEVKAVRGGPSAARADLLVIPVSEGRVDDALRPLERSLKAALARRVKATEFRGRAEDLLIHHVGAQAIALAGLGTNPQPAAWRRIGAKSRREADRQGARRVALYVGSESGRSDVLSAAAEGFLLAGYRFDRYRAERNGTRAERLTLLGESVPKPSEAKAVIDGVAAVAARVAGARDLVNEPPSVATPTFIADHARALAKATPGLGVEVWDPKRIAKEKLAGLAAVARGSHEEPRFITLHYKGEGARRRIALIGKGITFDSGGLSLKPAKSMETMKYDMAGGAAVLGAVAAAAALKLPVDVIAYVPATENLPGERAQKPGDVIRYANGKSVEVLNTDAEGRLILADALTLASRSKPDAIIDLATLTGAARIALGALYAGVLGNDQPLIDALLAAAKRSGEPLWQLPLVREYRDDLRSPIADLKNVGGGGEGGTIVAALFLEEFVASGVPWAHLDIAGPAFAEKDLPHVSRGATGYGVRLLVEYLKEASV